MNKAPSPPPNNAKTPWFWIPSLYFTEGLPYFAIIVLSAIMYKKLGVSNAELAFFTAWLYLPWVIKPLWSPFVELVKTKRLWIISMQFLLGAGLAGVALSLPVDNYVQYTMAFFWLLAFSSATHDIAADGYYMSALDDGQQAFFVGIRSTFYRLAGIIGQGLIVVFAGVMEKYYAIEIAWQMTFFLLAGILWVIAFYHLFMLPKVEGETATQYQQNIAQIKTNIINVFTTFFQKQHIALYLAFILFYRLGEAQLGKIAPLFMLDPREKGGLGLETIDIGIIYGTVGVFALVLGGIIGGILVSRYGLKYWIWWMALAINLPDLVYVFMAWEQPRSLLLIQALVAIEQFGYGFGFTAFMLYLIYIAQGEFKTAHYALATGFMAAGMMIPSMFSGQIQELLGYKFFFIWVIIASLPAFYIISRLPLNKAYGRMDQ
jgi:PAT family beta-lactamase induction signal transducer AmpG